MEQNRYRVKVIQNEGVMFIDRAKNDVGATLSKPTTKEQCRFLSCWFCGDSRKFKGADYDTPEGFRPVFHGGTGQVD
jgi:hypothetical protein